MLTNSKEINKKGRHNNNNKGQTTRKKVVINVIKKFYGMLYDPEGRIRRHTTITIQETKKLQLTSGTIKPITSRL